MRNILIKYQEVLDYVIENLNYYACLKLGTFMNFDDYTTKIIKEKHYIKLIRNDNPKIIIMIPPSELYKYECVLNLNNGETFFKKDGINYNSEIF